MAEIKKIIGIKNGVNSKGKSCQYLYLTEPFSDYDLSNSSCDGLKVSTEYCGKIYPVKVGDEVKVYHDTITYQGKPLSIVDDVVIVNSKK